MVNHLERIRYFAIADGVQMVATVGLFFELQVGFQVSFEIEYFEFITEPIGPAPQFKRESLQYFDTLGSDRCSAHVSNCISFNRIPLRAWHFRHECDVLGGVARLNVEKEHLTSFN